MEKEHIYWLLKLSICLLDCAIAFGLDYGQRLSPTSVGQRNIISEYNKLSDNLTEHEGPDVYSISSKHKDTSGKGTSVESFNKHYKASNGTVDIGARNGAAQTVQNQIVPRDRINTRSGTWVDSQNASPFHRFTPFGSSLKANQVVKCRNTSCAVTGVAKKNVFTFNKDNLKFKPDDINQQGISPVSGNQDAHVANELTNMEIMDESGNWHIGARQLYGIKRSKQALPPSGCNTLNATILLPRQHGVPSTGFNTIHNRRNVYGRNIFDDGSNIIRAKRDTDTRKHTIPPRYIKRLPSAEEVYIRLKTLDVVFYMPLNMTMNMTDSNATSDGLEKCMTLLEELYIHMDDDGKLYCNSSWDEVSCWPMTLAGTIASVPCPGYLTGITDSNNATKFCYENGTWADKAVYDFCLGTTDTKVKVEDEHGSAIRIIYNVGFTVSTLTLAIALFIFLYFRSLRCLRNLIHCHLIVTFIDTNILWIITRHSLLYLQDPSMAWLCKTLISIYRFSHATNFFWMFVEGLYLHIIIVWTYSADKIKLRYLMTIGWGVPALNLIIWIVLRLEFANDHCWLPFHDISDYDFAMIGPILLVLFANIIFLSTIVWVLLTKLRASHTLETRQYRKAVRATIILFPLLGITYVLFIIPPSDHPQVKLVFSYINAILQSFQGLLVAIFYCFLNEEVKSVLKKRFSRYNDARSLTTKYTKSSVITGYYGNSTTFGNGSADPKRRLNGSYGVNIPESIPLTDTKEVDDDLNEP